MPKQSREILINSLHYELQLTEEGVLCLSVRIIRNEAKLVLDSNILNITQQSTL